LILSITLSLRREIRQLTDAPEALFFL